MGMRNRPGRRERQANQQQAVQTAAKVALEQMQVGKFATGGKLTKALRPKPPGSAA